MTGTIQRAIEEIRNAFPGHTVEAESDGQDGACVRVHDLSIGQQYVPNVSWVAFRITFQYPHADIYPHFCVPGLQRADGKPLGEGIHPGHSWQTPTKSEPATMLSRRSNRRDCATDTAALKLTKVLDWLKNR